MRLTGLATIGALLLHAGVGIISSVLMAASGDYFANLNHPIQFVELGTGLLAGVAFLAFVARAHADARRKSPSEVRFETFWAVAGFLIPILNFFRPYQVLGDIWRVLTQSDETPVRVWWFGTLGILLTLFGVSKLIEPTNRIYLQVSGGVFSAALCLMTAYVVTRILRAQVRASHPSA